MATRTPPDPATAGETTAPALNGLDTEVLGGVVDMLMQNPDGGRATFFANSEWKDGARVSTRLTGYKIDGELLHQNEREHVIVADEPVEFGARDTAPAPPEMLLAAMGSCIAATANAYAALKGVRLTRLDIAVESDVDLHGFAGLDAGVRPGLVEIRTRITVGGDADEEVLREIALLGHQFSVTRDTVQNGTPVRPDVRVVN